MSEPSPRQRIWDIAQEHKASEQPDATTAEVIKPVGYTPDFSGPAALQRGWTPARQQQAPNALSWMKIPKEGGMHAIILSKEPYMYTSHWVDDRHRPCRGIDCPYHHYGIGSQERYVLTIFVPDLKNRGLLELGYKPISQLQNLLPHNQNARGLAVYLYHANNNPRGAIIVTPSDCTAAAQHVMERDEYGKPILPDEIDPSEILASTWDRAGRQQQ